jgi:hypothetical protein
MDFKNDIEKNLRNKSIIDINHNLFVFTIYLLIFISYWKYKVIILEYYLKLNLKAITLIIYNKNCILKTILFDTLKFIKELN